MGWGTGLRGVLLRPVVKLLVCGGRWLKEYVCNVCPVPRGCSVRRTLLLMTERVPRTGLARADVPYSHAGVAELKPLCDPCRRVLCCR